MQRTALGAVLTAGIVAAGIGTAAPAAADHVGQILDVANKGTVSTRSGTATITVTVNCLKGAAAHLDVELYQDNFEFGTYDVTYFTCTGRKQQVEIVYDGTVYPVPRAGDAYVSAYLEMPGYDGTPQDLYGEEITLRASR